MNIKRKEGGFYAAKVRLFLNEYSGISLEKFCKAENVSYNKMCNCLGRPAYQKDVIPSQQLSYKYDREKDTTQELPELELKPLVVDMDTDSAIVSSVPDQLVKTKPHDSSLGYLNNVRLRTAGQTEVLIGKCTVKVLAALIKEMEGTIC